MERRSRTFKYRYRNVEKFTPNVFALKSTYQIETFFIHIFILRVYIFERVENMCTNLRKPSYEIVLRCLAVVRNEMLTSE